MWLSNWFSFHINLEKSVVFRDAQLLQARSQDFILGEAQNPIDVPSTSVAVIFYDFFLIKQDYVWLIMDNIYKWNINELKEALSKVVQYFLFINRTCLKIIQKLRLDISIKNKIGILRFNINELQIPCEFEALSEIFFIQRITFL